MKRIVLKYGLIAGAILVAMLATSIIVVGNSTDFEKAEIYGYIFSILAFLMIFLGIREYRDKVSGGSISFNMGFRVGILITAIASVCYVAGWMLYYHFVDDSFIDRYTEFYIAKVKSSGRPQPEIENEITSFTENMKNYRNPFVMMMFTFLEVFPFGLVVTILCAFLMKRKPAS